MKTRAAVKRMEVAGENQNNDDNCTDVHAPAELTGPDGTALPMPGETTGPQDNTPAPPAEPGNPAAPENDERQDPVLQGLEIADEIARERRKKQQKKKNPTLQTQMLQIIEKIDRQSQRTDALFAIVRPPAAGQLRDSTPHDKVVGHSPSMYTHRNANRRHVQGSGYKRRSPKNGRSLKHRPSRAESRYADYSSPGSSSASESGLEDQVKQALDLLEPRFSHRRGKDSAISDKVKMYRPFAFLEREIQRDIMKNGHPAELSFLHHFMGLCGMATDMVPDRSPVHGILTHVSQVLEDYQYVQWPNIRAFSNTVLSNVAKAKWSWNDDHTIEKCRSRQYMRHTHRDDTEWCAPCPKYNKGRCDSADHHRVGEVMFNTCVHSALLQDSITPIHCVHVIRRRGATLITANKLMMKGGNLVVNHMVQTSRIAVMSSQKTS